jgi:hypothetical protein
VPHQILGGIGKYKLVVKKSKNRFFPPFKDYMNRVKWGKIFMYVGDK